jgi:hypothetical protein
MQLGGPPTFGEKSCCRGVTFSCTDEEPASSLPPRTDDSLDERRGDGCEDSLKSDQGSQGVVQTGGCGASFSSVSGGDVGWQFDDDDRASDMSGYSAHSGKVATDPEGSYFIRLVRFYKKYNPEKIARAEEFLKAYSGEEEQLFAILVSKYGPEPLALEGDNSENGSFCVSAEMRSGDSAGNCGTLDRADAPSSDFTGSPALQTPRRYTVPTSVSAAQGHTDCVTPYWPANKLVMDTDLLSLLATLKTSNEELKKCFLGLLAHHPSVCFNGMCYLTRAPLPQNASSNFLGHVWSGSLANNKLLVFDGVNYQRCVLHCTSLCQSRSVSTGANASPPDAELATPLVCHERWRLTIFRTENSSVVLYRTVWDPVIDVGRDASRNKFTSSNTRQKPVLFSTLPAGRVRSNDEREADRIHQPEVAPQRSPVSAVQESEKLNPVQLGSPEVTSTAGTTSTISAFSFLGAKKDSPKPDALGVSSDRSSCGSKHTAISPVTNGDASQPLQPRVTSPLGSDFTAAIQQAMESLEARIQERLNLFDARLRRLEDAQGSRKA